MKKILWCLLFLLITSPLSAQSGSGPTLPEGLKKEAYQRDRVIWGDTPEVPITRRTVRAEDVFALTPRELMECLQVLTGNNIKLSDVLPWYDDRGFRLYVNKPDPLDKTPLLAQIINTEGKVEKEIPLSEDPQLPQWFFADLEGQGYKPGVPLSVQIMWGKVPHGRVVQFVNTLWIDKDRQGKFRTSDRFPGVVTSQLSLAFREKLRASGLLAQEIRDFLNHAGAQVHEQKAVDPISAQGVRWWPGEIQNQNSYREWYITINRGDLPMTTRDLIFRDIPGLSPLEVQEAFRVLTGKAPELSDIMEEEKLAKLKHELLAFQAHALRFEIIEALKARDPKVKVNLPLEFVMDILSQGNKTPEEKAHILHEELLKTTGQKADEDWIKNLIIGKVFTPKLAADRTVTEPIVPTAPQPVQ